MSIEGPWGALVTDPWFVGKAFANGWSMRYAPCSFAMETLQNARFVWISHGHPDHFSPQTLLKIPKSRRSQIQVLLTSSPTALRLSKWCSENDFAVWILEDRKMYELPGGLEIQSGAIPFGDSWLGVRSGEASVLNLNDCHLSQSQLRYVSRSWANVNLLLMQYGVANWTGNAGDQLQMIRASKKALDRLEETVGSILPKMVLPFASEIRFCHSENEHLNEYQNSPKDVLSRMAARDQPSVFMQNGDSILVDGSNLISHSETQIDEPTEIVRSEFHEDLDLESLSLARLTKNVAFHGNLTVRLYVAALKLSRLAKVRILISEIQQVMLVSVDSIVADISSSKADLEMSCEMFAGLFTNEFGLDNLYISGRFKRITEDAIFRLYVTMSLDWMRANGLRPGLGLLFERGLLKSVFDRAFRNIIVRGSVF